MGRDLHALVAEKVAEVIAEREPDPTPEPDPVAEQQAAIDTMVAQTLTEATGETVLDVDLQTEVTERVRQALADEAEAQRVALERDAEAKRLAEETAAARRWEGHTHKWGRANAAGVKTCSECALVLPAEMIGA